MATQDVPGANPANVDQLHAGCWAEHDDGSLIFVKGAEGGRVVYEIYDVAAEPPVVYTDAMPEDGFKRQFSYPPVGKSVDRWTWHDKSAFPWDRVMKVARRPRPSFASVDDQMSAAGRVAESLRLRAREVHEENLGHRSEDMARRGFAILDRIANALESVGVKKSGVRRPKSRR